jgi:hypothetical protein
MMIAACPAPAPDYEPAQQVPTEAPAQEPIEVVVEAPVATAIPIHAPVSILIVDDFTAECKIADDGTYEDFIDCLSTRQNEYWQSLADKNCAFTPDGQAHYASHGVAHYASHGVTKGILINPPMSHGALVHSRIEQLLRQSEQAVRDNIEIVDVPTDGYTTESIRDAISDAISARPDSRFVINMSFVIMPCEAVPNLQDYLSGLRDASEGDLEQYLENLMNAWQWKLYESGRIVAEDNDPLYGYLKEVWTNRDDVIMVGAAGNNRAAYGDEPAPPYAPAVWDMVVSVSAGPDDSGVKYANSGEVQMKGMLGFEPPLFGDFIVAWPTVLDGTIEKIYGVSNRNFGTSFAAPELSYQAARYLLNNGPIPCSGTEVMPDTGDSIRTNPPLKYAPQIRSDENPNPYEDLDLATAAEKYCEGFPSDFPVPYDESPDWTYFTGWDTIPTFSMGDTVVCYLSKDGQTGGCYDKLPTNAGVTRDENNCVDSDGVWREYPLSYEHCSWLTAENCDSIGYTMKYWSGQWYCVKESDATE